MSQLENAQKNGMLVGSSKPGVLVLCCGRHHTTAIMNEFKLVNQLVFSIPVRLKVCSRPSPR